MNVKSFFLPVLWCLVFSLPLISKAQKKDTLWFHQIDLSRSTQDWKLTPKAWLALKERPLLINGEQYHDGLASPTERQLRFELDGQAQQFYTLFGLDDSASPATRITLTALLDQKEIYRSSQIRPGYPPLEISFDLKGAKQLVLIIDDEGTGLYADRANYANSFITYTNNTPVGFNFNYIHPRHILTPPTAPEPRFTGAKVFGVRPGHPFLFTVTATGKRPMVFAARNLPAGLTLDPQTGMITGKLKRRGESNVTLTATNDLGTVTRNLKIVAGDQIALTPPMGWNEYNRYGDSINDATIRNEVDAMVSSGLTHYGWTYINIDDGWSIHPHEKDSLTQGIPRDKNGRINANKKFPDMKGLTDYIHSKGLKAGIYTSPSWLTCSKYTASYKHELKDAQQFADWGFDYLKYDYCSYNEILKGNTVENLQKPYKVMRKALDKVDRDIVFSMSQYGMGDVWKWGEAIGGNSWRTTGDLIDTWESLEHVAFSQAGKEAYAGPGHWNDPDMLAVGYVGWGEIQYPSRMLADEQYTHISMWSLLAAPLLMGCDIGAMDAFTRNLFTNNEVNDINQDPLGKQASRVYKNDSLEIYVKELEDGSRAVGLFNRNEHTRVIKADWSDLGVSGALVARDVWRQRDEGKFTDHYQVEVPAHGVKFITLRKDDSQSRN